MEVILLSRPGPQQTFNFIKLKENITAAVSLWMFDRLKHVNISGRIRWWFVTNRSEKFFTRSIS